MNEKDFARIEAEYQVAAKSTAPASKGLVLREIRAAVEGLTGVLTLKFREVQRRQESADQLLADIDQRLAAIEDRLAELDR